MSFLLHGVFKTLVTSSTFVWLFPCMPSHVLSDIAYIRVFVLTMLALNGTGVMSF